MSLKKTLLAATLLSLPMAATANAQSWDPRVHGHLCWRRPRHQLPRQLRQRPQHLDLLRVGLGRCALRRLRLRQRPAPRIRGQLPPERRRQHHRLRWQRAAHDRHGPQLRRDGQRPVRLQPRWRDAVCRRRRRLCVERLRQRRLQLSQRQPGRPVHRWRHQRRLRLPGDPRRCLPDPVCPWPGADRRRPLHGHDRRRHRRPRQRQRDGQRPGPERPRQASSSAPTTTTGRSCSAFATTSAAPPPRWFRWPLPRLRRAPSWCSSTGTAPT